MHAYNPNEMGVSLSKFRRWVILGALICIAFTVVAADATHTHAKREDLVGAWRLARIEVTGPQGATIDPFYGTGSEGLLIYDGAGWFSAQIMGSKRPALEVPAHRPENVDDARRVLKAAALDSYYAYYGTWTFDASTSTVTHHAMGALYPAEQDATYAQHVEVHGSSMIFTRTQDVDGQRSTQSKVWVRAVP